MTTTANFTILTEPLESLQGLKDQRQAAAGPRPLSRSKAETEPEARLWKLCAEVASPRLSVFEWVTFLLLGVLSLGALACGFWGLFHLFNTGALNQTVRALLTT